MRTTIITAAAFKFIDRDTLAENENVQTLNKGQYKYREGRNDVYTVHYQTALISTRTVYFWEMLHW